MNRLEASFIFDGETLFNLEEVETTPVIKAETSSKDTINQKKAVQSENLILVDFLSKETEELMTKILGSVNVKEMEVIERKSFPLYDFTKADACKKVIVFGEFAELNDFFSLGNKYSVSDSSGKKVLVADTLEKISENQNSEKRILWESLKTLFRLD